MSGLRFVLASDGYPELSPEEKRYDARRVYNARAHCPSCGGFTKPPKIVHVMGGNGTRRVADGTCKRCGPYEIALD